MPGYTSSDIHNVVLLGRSGAGKTALAEAMLRAGGAAHHLPPLGRSGVISDYTDEEKAHGCSLYASVLHCDHLGRHINLIDTPGGDDFAGHACMGLLAADLAIVVLHATGGVDGAARRMFQRARDTGKCLMIVVNQIDHPNLDLPALVQEIREAFGPQCLPMTLPAHGGTDVVDVFTRSEGDAEFSNVHEAHRALVEQIVEVDDGMLERYFNQGDVPADELHDTFERALREGHLVPICFTSAAVEGDPARNVGVTELLDLIERLAPTPGESIPAAFVNGNPGQAHRAAPDPALPLLAHVFKVEIDRFGKLAVFRVHQGRLAKDDLIYIGNARKPIKVHHLYKVQGRDHVEVHEAIPGDICGVLKIDEAHVGSVLRSQETGPTQLVAPPLPQPMFGLALVPKRAGEEQKITDALHRIQEEDPCLRRHVDPVTHETVIYGLGDAHVRLLLEHLRGRHHLDLDTKPPKIAYRETVTATAKGQHRHRKQTGGAGQFGEVHCTVEPTHDDQTLDFVDDLVGESIPRQFLPAIRKGVEQAVHEGALAGYPIQGVRVRITDGKHHPVDSKEIAFVTAGRKAFIDAYLKARPALLEPIVKLVITAPSSSMGDITSDLTGKRGRVLGADLLPGDQMLIRAQAPLAEMGRYGSQLKSVTAGRASFSMEMSHYEAAPPAVQAQVAAQYKPRPSDD